MLCYMLLGPMDTLTVEAHFSRSTKHSIIAKQVKIKEIKTQLPIDTQIICNSPIPGRIPI
jgi:hypothetical protein